MAVFTNELKLDAASFTTTLKKAATDSKATADEIQKALTIKPEIDSKEAASQLNGFADNVKSKFSSVKDELKNGLQGSLTNIGSAVTGGIIGSGIADGIQAVGQKIVQGFQFVIDKGSEFQSSLAALSAITGVSGDDLDKFGEKAKELAAQFGGDANTQIGAFQTILSKFGPGLADTPDALNAVTENVNILAKAAGLDAQGSVDALSNALLQFGVDASDPAKLAAESGRFINVLASSAKEGAAEIPQVAEAILQAGVAAKGANLSFEETNAAIQALAVGGKVGSEAGVSLRNVLGLLIKQSGPGEEALRGVGLSVEQLGKTLTTQGLQAALGELQGGINKLGSDAEKAAFKATLFGTENAAAAGILLDNVDTIGTFTTAMTGTSEATTQAQKNMATFTEFMSRVKANLGNVAIDIFQGFEKAFGMLAELTGGQVGKAFDEIGETVKNMYAIVEPILMAIGGVIMGTLVVAINMLATAFQVSFGIINSIFDGIKNALQPVINAIMQAFGMDGAMGQSIDVVQMFKDALSTVTSVLSAVGEVVSMVGKFVIELLLTPLQAIVGVITAVITKIREWIGVSKESNDETKRGTGFLDILRNAFANIKGTIGGVTEAFREIKNVIAEFFNALASFNIKAALEAFTGFGDKVAKAYNDGFNKATKPAVEAQKEVTGEVAKTEAAVKSLGATRSAVTGKEKKEKEKAQDSEFAKAQKILKTMQDQLKTERETTLALEQQAGLAGDALKLRAAQLEKADIDKVIAEAKRLFKVETDKEGRAISTTVQLDTDKESVDQVKSEYDKLLVGKIQADLKLRDPKFWFPQVKQALDIFNQFRGGISLQASIELKKEAFTALAKGASVLGFDFLKVTKKAFNLGGALQDTARTAAEAITKIDWNKVFARPAKASEEATAKIVDSITEGTLSYQDGIDKLSESIEKVPTVFEAVTMQLNESFRELTNQSIAALSTAAKGAKVFGDVYNELANVAGSAFAQILTEQEDFGKASLMLALDVLEALVPILVAEILGKSFAQNPILGAIIGGAATATLLGLLAAAKASVAGFAEGGYTGNGGKYQPAGVVHKGEFVINKENTSKFRGILEQMNQGKLPLTMNASIANPEIQNEMYGMRQELAAIRQRLDRMPDGIQGRTNVGVNVGLDTYLFRRDNYRAAVAGLRG